MSSNRAAYYTLYLNSNVRQLLQQTEQSAMSLDKTMQSLRSGLATVGLGLAARELIQTGKEWISGAADYETAMMRIVNASKDATSGLKNKLFIGDEVNKLKLDLQESADSYGQFLLKIKNSGLNNNEVQRLFDNLSVVGKVGAIPASQIAPAIRDVAIMLGEGVLEGRHLRMLTYVHPQLTPFIADELGIKGTKEQTKNQILSEALSTGKLTKAALDSHILVDAIEKYRQSVEGGLPEALKTLTSETNDLGNSWLSFKNTIVLDSKPAIVALFKDLEEGVHWLKEHREGIEKTINVLVRVGAAYAAIKIALGSYRLISGLFLTETIAQTTAFAAEAVAAQSLATALAEINANIIAMNQQQIISGLTGGGMINQQLRKARGEIAAGSAVVGAEEAVVAGGALSMGQIIAVALGTAVVIAAATALARKIEDGGHGANTMYAKNNQDLPAFNLKYGVDSSHFTYGKKFGIDGHSLTDDVDTTKKLYDSKFFVDSSNMNHVPQAYLDLGKKLAEHPLMTEKQKEEEKAKKALFAPKIPKASSIKGNSVTNINIEIKEMNGMNKPVFSVSSKKDMDDIEKQVGDIMVKLMTSAVNDSQLVGNHH